MQENQKLTDKQVDEIIAHLLTGHASDVVIDEKVFTDLLRHSLSLNTLEKKRVIDSVPGLSQFQFDELTKVFLEEREKFKELAGEHPEDVKKLVVKQQTEWIQLGDLYLAEIYAAQKALEDQNKIDDIKSNLGL